VNGGIDPACRECRCQPGNHHPIIGRDADGGVLQPPELVAYNERLSEMKEAIMANLVTRDTRFDVTMLVFSPGSGCAAAHPKGPDNNKDCSGFD